jgi:hypothetical protein
MQVGDTVIDNYDNLYTVRRVLYDNNDTVIEVQGIGRNILNTRFYSADLLEAVDNPQEKLLEETANMVLISLNETYHSIADKDVRKTIVKLQTDIESLFESYHIKFVDWYDLNNND